MTAPVKPLFAPVPGRSRKIECTVCHAKGYETDWDGDYPHSWKRLHERGHSICPQCGRPLTLKLSGRPRVHTRCPRRRA